MLDIGKTVQLEVLRSTPMGLILGDLEDEVLLPRRYVPEGATTGERLEVFLHTDSEDRPIATTERPIAEADEFASLRVVSLTSAGAFLDWGLPKDLFLPIRLQLQKVRPRQKVVVRILCDAVSSRPIATMLLERFLEPPADQLREGQEVQLLVYEETDMGRKAIIDGRFGGLLYHEPGERGLDVASAGTGYVQRIRADGKVDLTLTPTGKAGIVDARETLLKTLAESGGRLELTDHSDPDVIRQKLGLSKKAFKRAVGALYRERLIRIEDSSIELVEPTSPPKPPR